MADTVAHRYPESLALCSYADQSEPRHDLCMAQNALDEIRDTRRKRLAALLDEYGKTRLAAMVDVSADYLWQMGKGAGQSARGISDKNAAKIEAGAGKPAGWLSGSVANAGSQPVRLDPEMIRDVAQSLQDVFREQGWDFRIEESADLFAEYYEERVRMGNISPLATAVRVGKWMERNGTGKNDGRNTPVPSAGADPKKAGGRKKG
jgi:hypothetical protein